MGLEEPHGYMRWQGSNWGQPYYQASALHAILPLGPRNFIVLGCFLYLLSTLSYLYNYDVKYGLKCIIFCAVDIQLLQYCVLIKHCHFSLNCLVLLPKLSSLYMCVYFWTLVCSSDLFALMTALSFIFYSSLRINLEMGSDVLRIFSPKEKRECVVCVCVCMCSC